MSVQKVNCSFLYYSKHGELFVNPIDAMHIYKPHLCHEGRVGNSAVTLRCRELLGLGPLDIMLIPARTKSSLCSQPFPYAKDESEVSFVTVCTPKSQIWHLAYVYK